MRPCGSSEPVGAAVRSRQRPTSAVSDIRPTKHATTGSALPLARRQNRPRKSSKLLILLGTVSASLVVFLFWLKSVAVLNHKDVEGALMHVLVPPNAITKRRPQQRQRAPGQAIETVTDVFSSAPKILTAYLESPSTLDHVTRPLPIRNTTASLLKKIEFPNVNSCGRLMQDFPVDNYPLEDPFLPWIHDYFPSHNGTAIQFVCQNKRRCDTGDNRKETMRFWEPQMALFQAIPIVHEAPNIYKLADSYEHATHPETRFQCRFHTQNKSITTLSVYSFNYEHVTWRKGKKIMFEETGKDSAQFWLSTLLFSCPVPDEFQPLIGSMGTPQLHLDLIPIRTPARRRFLLTPNHTGPELFKSTPLFDTPIHFGTDHILPHPNDAGRWANLPICSLPVDNSVDMNERNKVESTAPTNTKPNRLVACTWAASSYSRRGDVIRVSDSAARLEEWIHFHLLVGFDHLYVYDNSDIPINATSDLQVVAEKFSTTEVTYHRWPCRLCNNNKPGHKNPGERSSQYAAESSCRERYGEITDWMAFIDTDEYLVPMTPGNYKWNSLLDEMDRKSIKILKLLSSRGKPRVDMMEELPDQTTCVDPEPPRGPNADNVESCTGPRRNETFLKVYNCDFIRPPKPERFARAMKQIYRPDHVLSHFVHYSTVTAGMAQSYSEFVNTPGSKGGFGFVNKKSWTEKAPERFLNELNEGALVHARSVLPHETRRRTAECFEGSKANCILGFVCDDAVPFVDEKHKNNNFHNPDGSFCDCWRNPVIDDILAPKLEARLKGL